jgi:hypothetical protein
MTRTILLRVIVVALVALVLGGASLILLANGAGAVADAPSGFFH